VYLIGPILLRATESRSTDPEHVDARAEDGPEEYASPATRLGLRLAAGASLALLAVTILLVLLL
jgi:hypothetical protein